jgi:CheY-like chemotaxis protein
MLGPSGWAIPYASLPPQVDSQRGNVQSNWKVSSTELHQGTIVFRPLSHTFGKYRELLIVGFQDWRHVCASCKDSDILETRKAAAIVVANKKIVVIVEDDASMLKGLERLLSAHGFVTEVYSSAEAFLERTAVSEACCLVLDIHLGGISGIELKRRLAVAGPRRPVIFMTAIDSELVQREATEAGCIAYLRKPFPARQLIDAIRNAVV